jgi:hypothetical protein
MLPINPLNIRIFHNFEILKKINLKKRIFHLIPIVAIGCILVAGCTKTTTTKTTTTASTTTQTIMWAGIDAPLDMSPVTDSVAHRTMGTGRFTYDLDSFITAETKSKFTLENVDSFKCSSAKITLINPDSVHTIANFRIAQINFFSGNKITDTLLAEVTDVPTTTTTELDLPAAHTNSMKSYLPPYGALTFTYGLGGTLRRRTDKILKFNIHVEFYIHLKK